MALTGESLENRKQELYLREATRHFSGLQKPLKCGPVVENLNHLIRALHEEFSKEYVNVEMVNHLMLAYKSNPKEWQKFAKFDRYKYTRNLVDSGNGKFNLMILCWGEGQCSTIHDHSDSHCFMKTLKGELQEVRYAMPSSTSSTNETAALEETGRTSVVLNDVAYINDNLGIHRVENPSHSETAVSLHLYCPPFEACTVYDKDSTRKLTCPMTYWSKYGQKVSHD